MNSTVQNTASTALGLSGGTLALYWLLACVKAGSMEMPDQATITAIVATLAPITHAASNFVVSWFANRVAKVDVITSATEVAVALPKVNPQGM